MKELILTPHGYIGKEKVIHLDNSMSIEISDYGHVVSVSNENGRIMNDYGPATPNTLLDSTKENQPGYSVVAAASGIKSFKTTWTVPEKPLITNSPDTFFIWNGVARGKLQPVLMWGNGEPAYRLMNWASVGGNYVHGNYVFVNPGDTITGVVSLERVENGQWHYLISFEGYPYADLRVVSIREENGVSQCFESYARGSDRIPSNQICSMTNIHLEVIEGAYRPEKFDWRVLGHPANTPSGKNTDIVNRSTVNGQIDFYFH